MQNCPAKNRAFLFIEIIIFEKKTMGTRACFYDSSKSQDLICAFLFKNAYPTDGDLFDTAGLATAAITTQINTITAASQFSVFVVADIGTNPPSGNLTAAQVTALDAKLAATSTGADSAPREIQLVTANTLANRVKNKCLVMWESLYPETNTVNNPPKLVQLMGRRYMYNVILPSTMSAASGASTATDSSVNLPVDSLIGKYIETTGGTGLGQVRKITSNSATVYTVDTPWTTALDNTTTYIIRGYNENEKLEFGGTAGTTATSGGANTISLSTATWTTNQWVGYSVRIIDGTNAYEELPILSNTATQLTVSKNWAGGAADNTSVFQIVSYNYQNSTVTPQAGLQDIVATSGSANTIGSSALLLPTNQYATGFQVVTTSGTGAGQTRDIASNTGTVFTTTQNWAVNPVAGTVFEIVSRGGTWPYEYADLYLNLAIPTFMNSVSTGAQYNRFVDITGLQTDAERLQTGGGQDLNELAALIEQGQNIYTYLL